MEMTGGCLCRAVRYRSSAEPIITRVCWCRVCQYLGAGSGSVNTCFARNTFAIDGELRDFVSVAASGSAMHRRFCPACGTQLFSEAEARPHLIFVRSGTLDDPERVRPSSTIWTSSAPSCASIDTSLPCVATQPPPVR